MPPSRPSTDGSVRAGQDRQHVFRRRRRAPRLTRPPPRTAHGRPRQARARRGRGSHPAQPGPRRGVKRRLRRPGRSSEWNGPNAAAFSSELPRRAACSTSAANRPGWRLSATRTGAPARLAACSAARITFGLLGRTSTSPHPSSLIASAKPRSAHRSPSPSSRPVHPRPRTGAGCRPRWTRPPRPSLPQHAGLTLCGLPMHVAHLDPLEHADRDGELERPTRLVGVHVHLQGRAIADHQRVAVRGELGLERLGVQLLALDHEDRAVAVPGELTVRRLDGRALPAGASGRGRLPATMRAMPRQLRRRDRPPPRRDCRASSLSTSSCS